MTALRLALCQVDAVVGDLAGNVRRILDALEEVEQAGADLAIFPELVIPGYPPEDLLLAPGFVEANVEALDAVAAATRRCAAVVGFVECDQDLHNSAAVCAGGKVHGVWRKHELPNYAVFDERRYFAPGPGTGPLYSVAGARIGVTICEDSWSPAGPVLRHAAGGADLVVSINASPYRAGVLAGRERMLATRAADASCALAYVNLVGGQDELVFDGASMVFGADGALQVAGPQFREAVVVCDLELGPVYRKHLLDPRGREPSPPSLVVPVSERLAEPRPALAVPSAAAGSVAPRLGPVEEIYEALVLGTRDYALKNHFTDVGLQLSGGIDSAFVATVAADAVGPEHVHAVLMPSRFTSKASVADAEAVAGNLRIHFSTIPIEPAHGLLLDLLQPYFEGLAEGAAEENLQSRIRGVLLMALSNKLGWLVLTTGNKSEMAVGYATLYGDMAGGFAVIKDVPKTLVFELSRMRNARAGHDLVPESILTKPPSAELRADQRDDQSLPPYEILDPILEGYVERDRTVEEMVAAGLDEAVVRRVIRLVDLAEYKRRQAPPGVRVTTRAFGKDRRMPITNGYRP